MVKAQIRVSSKGKRSLSLWLASTCHDEHGNPMAVLRKINFHRRADDLPEVLLADIRLD